MLPSDVPEAIYSNPALLAALTVALLAIAHYSRGLAYREVVALETLKAYAFRALDPLASRRGRPLTTEAHDADFITTLNAGPRAVVTSIRPPFAPNLTSTAKYRTAPDGDVQYAHSQWREVYDRDGDRFQTHGYLFPAPDGTSTDVYAHVEAPPEEPEEHTDGEQVNGDAHQRFADAYVYSDAIR